MKGVDNKVLQKIKLLETHTMDSTVITYFTYHYIILK